MVEKAPGSHPVVVQILGFLLSGVALNELGLIRNISDVKALSELGILFLVSNGRAILPLKSMGKSLVYHQRLKAHSMKYSYKGLLTLGVLGSCLAVPWFSWGVLRLCLPWCSCLRWGWSFPWRDCELWPSLHLGLVCPR